MSRDQDTPPYVITPTAAHRAAADRAARLAHEHGAVEVAAFFATLPSTAQPVVFALMARAAARRGPLETTPPDVPSPWWTAAELREAHRLWALGHREKWIDQGNRIYRSHLRRGRIADLEHDQVAAS